MRLGPGDKFWVVTDPTPKSEIQDILFETCLRELELQFKGGLTAEENPTIFTDKAEAEVDARGRQFLLRALEAIAHCGGGKTLLEARRVALLDGEGKIVLEVEIGWRGPGSTSCQPGA
jgi:hypothetical protein